MNSIPSGRRTNNHNFISFTFRSGRYNLICFYYSHRHCIYQRIALVTFIKIDFTRNCWHSETISIIAYSSNNSIKKKSCSCIF